MEQVWRKASYEHLFHKADGTPNDVWRGKPGLPSQKQGVTLLGDLGRAEFEGQLAEKIEEHGIPLGQDHEGDRCSKRVALVVVLRSVQGKPRSPCGPS